MRETRRIRCAAADRSPRSAAAPASALPARQTAPAAWESRGTRRRLPPAAVIDPVAWLRARARADARAPGAETPAVAA